MQRLLTLYLIVTGIGAFVALTMPWLVILGFFALIIPGLILSLMPTAFLYGVIFALAWVATRSILGDGLIPIAAGLAAVAVVVVAIVQPTRALDMKLYRDSILPDVAAAGGILLKGNVRFDTLSPRMNKSSTPGYRYVAGEAGFACDGYCLAALFTPGVTSVTLNKSTPEGSGALSPEARTYRLERRPSCESNAEVNFNSITSPLQSKYEDGKMLVSQWAMKLASEYCLVMGPPLTSPDFTIVERQSANGARPKPWDFGPGRLATQTVEIFERGTLIYRSHQSSITTLASFLHIMPTGGMEDFRFGWARSTTNSKRGYDAVNLARSLEQHSNLAGKAEPGSAKQKTAMLPDFRRQLGAALDDPALTEKSPNFQILETYFEAVGGQATDEDVALISRLVADQRLTRFPGAWSLKLPLAQARPIYDAYTKRLVATGVPMEMQRSLIPKFVANLGDQSIGLVGPAQQQLLANPATRLAVPELVKALGYGEAANGKTLLAMLRQHAAVVDEIRRQRDSRQIKGHGREQERDSNLTLIGAAESGLCLLGPKAAGIRQELDDFLSSGIMPTHLVEGHSMTDWNVILARMGKPIETISKPKSMSGPEANYRRNLRSKVDHWKPDRC